MPPSACSNGHFSQGARTCLADARRHPVSPQEEAIHVCRALPHRCEIQCICWLRGSWFLFNDGISTMARNHAADTVPTSRLLLAVSLMSDHRTASVVVGSKIRSSSPGIIQASKSTPGQSKNVHECRPVLINGDAFTVAGSKVTIAHAHGG